MASLHRLNALRPVVILDEALDLLPGDRIECSDLRAIARVWLDLPRESGESLPRWSSFSPSMITPYLYKVCILHVGDQDKDDIEFTLYGGHPTEHIGNGKPLRMHELRADKRRRNNYRDIRERAIRAITNQAPQYARKTLSWDGLDEISYELLMLPFRTENGITRVLQPLTSEPRPQSDELYG